MKQLAIAAALVVMAVVMATVTALPPSRRTLPSGSTDGTIPGIVHVHTVRSDGRGTPDEVAQAAARAGLKFVIFTDHGDATRQPDPPAYRSGVLCLDGVEISTTGGHYAAVGLGAAPYPLGGASADVVEDVRRLGGFGIVAHPDSPKAALEWSDWTVPFDAVEMLNLDTGWRRHMAAPDWRPRLYLAQALLAYQVRPSETIASLLEPGRVIERWAALAAHRRVVMTAGADAHAKLGLRGAEPGDNRFSLPFPGYEATLATLSVHARLDKPLSGDASVDADALLRAFRGGHLYTALDALATPPSLEVTATSASGSAREGDELAAGGAVTFHVRTNAPAGFALNLWNGTTLVATREAEPEQSIETRGTPGVYWIEIRERGLDKTWLAANPVYVRDQDATPPPPPTPRPPATHTDGLFDGSSTSGWRIEHDEHSLGAVEVAGSLSGPELRFRYGLATGTPAHRYVALIVDRPAGIPDETRLGLTIRAEGPMRVSVQLRAPREHGDPDRWERSLYLDARDQTRTIFFDELRPMGTAPASPDRAAVRSVMIVVDEINRKPGSSGRIWIKRAVLEH